MIKISVDPAVAYDMLSILSVKSAANPAVRPDWDRMIVEIIEQVGQEKHDQVMKEVYPILYAVNSAIFNRIDDLKKSDDPIDAREIDALNLERWQTKRRLQKRFFSEEPLSEIKLGYINT